MAHLKYSASTGHLLHNAAGHLVNECECDNRRCPEWCLNRTPSELLLTFSGVQLCPCEEYATGHSRSTELTYPIDGDYILPWGGDDIIGGFNTCPWTLQPDKIAGSPSITRRFWTNADCSGDPVRTESRWRILYVYIYNFDVPRWFVAMAQGRTEIYSGADEFLFLNHRTEVGGDCVGPLVLPNTYTPDLAACNGLRGYGGTCTLRANC